MGPRADSNCMTRAHPSTPLWVKLTALLLVGGAAAWWIADWRDRRGNERRLGSIASEIAGRSVEVRCPGPLARLFGWGIAEGSVRFDASGAPADETSIREQSCTELDALAEGRRAKELACIERARILCGEHGRETAMAVDVLAHESWHLRGVVDEAETECRSLQTMAGTAVRLGATAEQGRALARAQFEGAYPAMPEPYRSGACVDGGELDLRPDDPRFP
jgi:hypothetical protein